MYGSFSHSLIMNWQSLGIVLAHNWSCYAGQNVSFSDLEKQTEDHVSHTTVQVFDLLVCRKLKKTKEYESVKI